jgi:integrase
MGRRPSTHQNLPPHMRKRVRKYGTYYFLDTGAKPRKEIPLGTDYIVALKKYAELYQIGPTDDPLFNEVILKYEAEILPNLATSTIRVQKSDIIHIRKYFGKAPIDSIEPSDLEKFKQKHGDKPTTANRCLRLFSSMWNYARGWGYTNLTNPRTGIKGYKLKKRTVYITDQVLARVYEQGTEPLQDALDIAYLTGQRPGDSLGLDEARDIAEGQLQIKGQDKTGKPLRIQIIGKLASVVERIRARKRQHKIVSTALLVNEDGKKLTPAMLRNDFVAARKAAAQAAEENGNEELAAEIRKMWFYDLRAKAADDTAEHSGDQAASDLLGHETVTTTKRHYLRRGKVVKPVK